MLGEVRLCMQLASVSVVQSEPVPALLAWKFDAEGLALRHLSRQLVASLSRDSGLLPC